ncbi:MAG: 16S rRNA (uracil(1498)-N(3))-methyltransferase [Phormidesmis sp.]
MIQRITIESDQQKEALLNLRPDQAHYLHRVLRLKEGDRFIAQDGKGQQWLAVLTKLPAQAQVLEEKDSLRQSSTAPLRLIAALPKGNSFDQVVRQATELGVSHIYPVMSDRTLLRPKGNKLERWRRIANEASEQSERVTVPEVASPVSLKQCLQQTPWEGLCYICAARQNAPHLLFELQAHLTSGDVRSVNLMIGPEGGWTSDEITVAIHHSYKVVSLGSAILRATTAAVTALSLVTSARELLI